MTERIHNVAKAVGMKAVHLMTVSCMLDADRVPLKLEMNEYSENE